ncbi:D-Ala-D-Ala carboxypeptidase family metallohydrolase [Luteithermobacter gelatinilyticus]|uniref:D-Ala-D-Ala carboxypeptidase family metallohydrolase n=1 Tax=Luteithermobacter gelatinilyticus TaxID=2582913 RepID=UPI001105CE47|nr:D-Ala-D-Ala carboxypeptidase family metallohydrolase [Luteithermobacter gelatinilyticus]|tara:strand:- start:702 stop:1148 length:447 start_codon:yes stop_codon:yes gene_type:complete
MKLSAHFSLDELVRSETALRRGLDNTPPPPVIEKLALLVRHILEPVRTAFSLPFSPSSGYRCPALNRLLGSRETSQHIRGEAVDFRLPGIPLIEVAHWIRDHLDYDQLILEFYDPLSPGRGWLHCSWVGTERNRHDALIFDGHMYRRF